MLITVLVAIASLLGGVACTPLIWKTHASLAKKILWTPVVFLPVVGPVFYGGFYEVPEPTDINPPNESRPIVR